MNRADGLANRVLRQDEEKTVRFGLAMAGVFAVVLVISVIGAFVWDVAGEEAEDRAAFERLVPEEVGARLRMPDQAGIPYVATFGQHGAASGNSLLAEGLVFVSSVNGVRLN